MKTFQFIPSTIIAFLVLTGSIASAAEYKIKLARPLKVGQQYTRSVTASVKESADTTINGQAQPQQSEGSTFVLQGTVTVLGVNAKTGGVTKLTCKVDKLTRDGQEVYPVGTVISAQREGAKAVFTVDGKPTGDDNQELLNSVLQLADPKATAGNDETTGTDQPQKVGGSWPIDSVKMARQIGASELPITGDITKGQSTLVKIDGLHDDEMTIQTVVTAEGFKKTMPDGSKMSNGKLRMEATSILAVDPSIPLGTSTNKVRVTYTFTLLDGQVSNVTVERESKEENRPI